MSILFISSPPKFTQLSEQTIVIDLSKEIFCPFSIAYQLAQKLNEVQKEVCLKAIFEPIIFLDFSDITNIWYGLESLGNTNVIKAKSLAALLGKFIKVNQKIDLVGDRYISEENLAFLWYLEQFHSVEINFNYQNSRLAEQYKNIFQTLKEYPEEDFIFTHLSGQYNQDINKINTDLNLITENSYFKVLETKKIVNKDLLANNKEELIILFAWQILSTGATDLALYLLSTFIFTEKERALNHKLLQVYLGFLLGLQKYKLIVEVTKNINDVENLNNFNYIKGYSYLIFNQISTAEKCFCLAEINQDMTVKTHYDLYKLNILSLLKFKQHQVEEALKIQNQIKSYQKSVPQLYKTNIHYTNELNLGRLNRYLKNYDLALSHFQTGFKQLEGFQQQSDHLYYCLLVAEIYELKKEYKNYFLYLTLAALIWSSLPCKNAVNWRILVALFKKGFKFNESLSSTAIANIFINKLNVFLEQGYFKIHEIDQIITIRLISEDEKPVEGLCYSFDLINFRPVKEESNLIDPFENSLVFKQLNKLLTSIIIERTKCQNMSDYNTIYINFDLAQPPKNFGNLRNRNNTVVSEIALNETEIFIILHPAIAEIKKIGIFNYAFYKRYFPPQIIANLEQQIINFLVTDEIFTLAKLKEKIPQITNDCLIEMENKRLLKIKYIFKLT